MTRLAQVDRLARHVRAREDDHPRLVVERQIVRRHRPPRARLQHRMTALDDLEASAVVHHRPHVAARVRHLGQRGRHVEQGQRARRRQQVGGARGHAAAQLVEQFILELPPPLVGAERLGLVLLDLGGDVAPGPGQRLPPQVLGRRLGGLGVGDLDAVAEDAVEAHAQAGDARARALALLEPGDPAARLGRVADDGVERLAPAGADDAAVGERGGRLVDQRRLERLAQIGEIGQRRPRLDHEIDLEPGARGADRLQRRQARAQADQVAGVGDAQRGAAGETGEIADRFEQPSQRGAGLGRVHQRRHGVLPRPDGAGIEQWLEQPLAQQPHAQRRDGRVHHAEQRAAGGAVARLQQLQRAHGGLVERHAVGRPQALQADDVAQAVALGGAHVGERGGAGGQAGRQVAEAEGVERGDAEVPGEIGGRAARVPQAGIGERQRGAGRLQARHEVAAIALALRQQHLGRAPQQRRGQHGVLAGAVLAHPEVAGRHVEQRHAGGGTAAAERHQEVVGGARQVGAVGQRAGRHHAHHVAVEQLLARASALHLLADGDLLAGLHQPRDVAVGRVVRDAGHRDRLARGQRDLQQPRAQLGVLGEQLVEVAQAKQQQVVREAALQLPVLRHHRRRRGVVSHYRAVP